MEEASTAGSQEPRVPNLIVRIGQVFVSPGRLFEALAARPVWVDVLALLVVSGIAAQLLLPEETFREIFAAQVPPNADPAQVERMIGFMRKWGLAVGIISLPVSVSVVAGILLLAYNVILGGEGTFRQLFSATTHAFLIVSAGGWLVLGLILLFGSQQVVLSPALAIEGLVDLGSGYLSRFAYRINIFSLWTCAVLGIAVSRIYPRRSAAPAAIYVGVLYLLVVALSAIPGG